MIDRLLLEKMPLAGIARVMQVSEDWLRSLRQPILSGSAATGAGATQTQAAYGSAFLMSYGHLWTIWATSSGFGASIDVHTREIVGCYKARPFWCIGNCTMGIDARSVSTMRRGLHRLLSVLSGGAAKQTPLLQWARRQD